MKSEISLLLRLGVFRILPDICGPSFLNYLICLDISVYSGEFAIYHFSSKSGPEAMPGLLSVVQHFPSCNI